MAATVLGQYEAIGGELRDQVQSVGGAVLTIASRKLDNDGLLVQSVTATEDGRGAITEQWHTGESELCVYVERYSIAGRTFHGWIDAGSRRLVQSG